MSSNAVPAVERPDAVARQAAVRRAGWLTAATIGWNAVEAVVAITAGIAAGAVSLVGFGLDSVVEVSAALVLAWRLYQERRIGCTAEFDRRATRAIARTFAALACYLLVESLTRLRDAVEPEASTVGIVLAVASLAVMPVLARAKTRLAPVLGSQAVASEARQTALCASMSAVLLAGLVAHAAFGWWWADPVAGLTLAAVAAIEARRAWTADSLADTCCA